MSGRTEFTVTFYLTDEEIQRLEKIVEVFKKKGGIELVPANPYCLSRSFTKEEINSLPVKILGRVVEGRTRNAFK